MNSIDFIDEAGREWANASRYRALEKENAALHKRVEELEREARFFENESNQWNAKWVKMEARAKKAEAESLAARNLGQAHLDRAEKAEQERDEAVAFRQQSQDTAVEALRQRDALQADLDEAQAALWRVAPNTFTIEALGAVKDQFEGPGETYHAAYERVKADLDAALKWIDGCTDGPHGLGPTSRRVLALLEKRRENRG